MKMVVKDVWWKKCMRAWLFALLLVGIVVQGHAQELLHSSGIDSAQGFAARMPEYKILQNLNTDGLQLQKVSNEGQKLFIKIIRHNHSIIPMITDLKIEAGGKKLQTSAVPLMLENYELPIEVNIRYKTLRQYKNDTLYVNTRIQLLNPGTYQLIIYNQ